MSDKNEALLSEVDDNQAMPESVIMKGAEGDAEPNPLGVAPITRLIWKFAVPSIISMLVSAAYNVTDQIFIGQLVGIFGNAATNVSFPMTVFTSAVGLMFGTGTAANLNICMGAKKMRDAERYLGVGITLMSTVGIVIMAAALLFRTQILILCGATENVLPFAEDYFRIYAYSIPFFMFTMAASYIIRADGSPGYSMICIASGAVLNIILDWLFMYVFLWGIKGAAAATAVAQVISFALSVAYLPRFKSIKIKASMLRIRWKYTIDIMKLGIPNFINHVIMAVVNIVMNNTLTHYGAFTHNGEAAAYGADIPLAVAGVITKLNAILIALTVGLSQGCQPVFSFNMGAKQYKRVKEAYKKAVIAEIAISILVFAALQLFPRQIVSIFGSGEELYYEFAERYLKVFMLMVCVFGVQPLSVAFFTSTGYSRLGAILSASRQGVFLIPLIIVLPLFLDMNGVLISGPIADAMACILSVTLVIYSFRNMTAMEKER